MDFPVSLFFGYIFTVFAGIFPIANPFSTAPVFLALTKNNIAFERNQIAKSASFYMASILLATLVAGALILGFFGITIPGLRIAGGIIIVILGIRMLFPSNPNGPSNQLSEEHSNIAFTPLAMPMLSGPGSISVVLSMADEVASNESILKMLMGYIVVGTGIIITVLACWVVLRYSSKILHFFGKSGIDVMTRLMAFILVAIGVEFFLGGLTGYLEIIGFIQQQTG